MAQLSLEDRVTAIEDGHRVTVSHFTVASLAIQKVWDELKKTNQTVGDFRNDVDQRFAHLEERMDATDAVLGELKHSFDAFLESFPRIVAEAVRLSLPKQ